MTRKNIGGLSDGGKYSGASINNESEEICVGYRNS